GLCGVPLDTERLVVLIDEVSAVCRNLQGVSIGRRRGHHDRRRGISWRIRKGVVCWRYLRFGVFTPSRASQRQDQGDPQRQILHCLPPGSTSAFHGRLHRLPAGAILDAKLFLRLKRMIHTFWTVVI